MVMIQEKSSTPESIPSWKRLQMNLASGAIAGGSTAVLFHPWDRALYTSVKHDRPFLDRANFTTPYRGVTQAVIQRTLSSGLYFFMQKEIKEAIYRALPHPFPNRDSVAQFSTGLLAGSFCGIITNPISAAKYYSWGSHSSFSQSTQIMWKQGGYKPFIIGMRATVIRDGLYGCFYEFTRSLLSDLELFNRLPFDPAPIQFTCNLLAAAGATVLSSPINYARVKQFSTPLGEAEPSIVKTLVALCHESKSEAKSVLGRAHFFYNRLKIGSGTARTAVGMAVGQGCFDVVNQYLTPHRSGPQK